jgi:outer membrane lipoprotein SlyB
MIADVRRRLDRVPFVPFVIRTSDGHEYSVPTVDHAKISPRGHRVVVFTDEDATAILTRLHINSIIDLQPNGE